MDGHRGTSRCGFTTTPGVRGKIMRIGRVYIPSAYIVDLDDEEMVERAKTCMYEDIMNAVKYNELENWIEDDPVDPEENFSEADIPEFLKNE
jgi:hypothetical protein